MLSLLFSDLESSDVHQVVLRLRTRQINAYAQKAQNY